jgi:hypothetical protein
VLGFQGATARDVQPGYCSPGSDPKTELVVFQMHQVAKILECGFQRWQSVYGGSESRAEISHPQTLQGSNAKLLNALVSAHFFQKKEGLELGQVGVGLLVEHGGQLGPA